MAKATTHKYIFVPHVYKSSSYKYSQDSHENSNSYIHHTFSLNSHACNILFYINIHSHDQSYFHAHTRYISTQHHFLIKFTHTCFNTSITQVHNSICVHVFFSPTISHMVHTRHILKYPFTKPDIL